MMKYFMYILYYTYTCVERTQSFSVIFMWSKLIRPIANVLVKINQKKKRKIWRSRWTYNFALSFSYLSSNLYKSSFVSMQLKRWLLAHFFLSFLFSFSFSFIYLFFSFCRDEREPTLRWLDSFGELFLTNIVERIMILRVGFNRVPSIFAFLPKKKE